MGSRIEGVPHHQLLCIIVLFIGQTGTCSVFLCVCLSGDETVIVMLSSLCHFHGINLLILIGWRRGACKSVCIVAQHVIIKEHKQACRFKVATITVMASVRQVFSQKSVPTLSIGFVAYQARNICFSHLAVNQIPFVPIRNMF